MSRLFTWDRHVARCLRLEERLLRRERKEIRRRIATSKGTSRTLLRPFRWVLVSDFDGTLAGDADALGEFLAWLHRRREEVLFCVATGRQLEIALSALAKWRVPLPDVLISAVGTEIFYGPSLEPDEAWRQHVRFRWRREALHEALRSVPGMAPQPASRQGDFKLSYEITAGGDPAEEVERRLREKGLEARVIVSEGAHLDVVPRRASKGLAIRHLSRTRGVPLGDFLVAGDSGNDAEMLVGETLAVVVGNHAPELEALRGSGRVYFARRPFAGGILEGIAHYGFAEPPAEAVPSHSLVAACSPS